MLIQKPPAVLGGDVWMLGTAAYPLYLLRGRHEGAIVEGGISALGPLLARQLEALGVGPQYVRQAVVTHAHPDHVMAVPAVAGDVPGAVRGRLGRRGGHADLGESDRPFPPDRRRLDRGPAPLRRDYRGPEGDSPGVAGRNSGRPPPAGRQPHRRRPRGGRGRRDRRRRPPLGRAEHARAQRVQHQPPRGGAGRAADLRRHGLLSARVGHVVAQLLLRLRRLSVGSLQRLAALDAEILGLSHNGAVLGRDDVRAYFAGAIAATQQLPPANRRRHQEPARPSVSSPRSWAPRSIARPRSCRWTSSRRTAELLVKQSLKQEGL